MNLNFHWINLLILFGALQALIFSIILLFQKRHPGSKFLAAFIFVFAYNGFETFNWSSGLDQHYIFFDLFGFIVIYAVGPSLYLYVGALLYPERKISARQVMLHYAPAAFQLVTRLAILIYHILWVNKIIDTSIHSMQLMNIVWFYAEPLSVMTFLAYFAASALTFRKYTRTNSLKLPVKEKRAVVGWLRALLSCMAVLAVAWPLTVLAPNVLGVPFGSHYYPVELALVLFTYWIVLYGYHRIRLIQKRHPPAPDLSTNHDLEKYLRFIKKAMEDEKLYLDPELSVGKLASHVGIPTRMISAALNQHHQTNFNDFVNAYRVKEVSMRLIDPVNQSFTISSIALDSGFNSHATFQRVFKNTTGMSPKEYMNMHLKKTG